MLVCVCTFLCSCTLRVEVHHALFCLLDQESILGEAGVRQLKEEISWALQTPCRCQEWMAACAAECFCPSLLKCTLWLADSANRPSSFQTLFNSRRFSAPFSNGFRAPRAGDLLTTCRNRLALGGGHDVVVTVLIALHSGHFQRPLTSALGLKGVDRSAVFW